MREGDEHRYNHHAELNLSRFKSLTSSITGYYNSKLQGFPTLVSTYIQCQNIGIHQKKNICSNSFPAELHIWNQAEGVITTEKSDV